MEKANRFFSIWFIGKRRGRALIWVYACGYAARIHPYQEFLTANPREPLFYYAIVKQMW
jgi:hypothetical protein